MRAPLDCDDRNVAIGVVRSVSTQTVKALAREPPCAAGLRLIQQSTDASEAAALVLAIQEFVANGGGRPWSAPPQCCIAGADGQSWPCRSAWLVAFRSSRLDDRFEGVPRVPDRTSSDSLVDNADTAALVLAVQGIVANDGAGRPVAGARALHRRGRRAAVAASVGVALRVPNREVVASPVRTPAYAHSSACAQWRGQSVGHRSRVPDRHRRQEALMGSFPDALAPIVQ
jgi:hypothetical protein